MLVDDTILIRYTCIMFVVNEDQSIKRKELQENLQSIGNEKNKEYERQVREGFENAHTTEEENKRFAATFLSSDEATSESAFGTLNVDKEKHTEEFALEARHRQKSNEPKCNVL